MHQFYGSFEREKDLQNSISREIGLKIYHNLAFDQNAAFCSCDEYIALCLGNIYNLDQLKKKYDLPGHNACQIIHDLFILKGDAWSTLADGEFVVIMQNGNELNVWRDRTGAGPQVYYSNSFFSSHLYHLLRLLDASPQIDNESLMTFLGIGYIPSPSTSLKGIMKLPAGSMLKYQNNSLKIESFYHFDTFINNAGTYNGTIEEATQMYKQLHEDSIKDRLGSSQNVGVLLSGGYDSGGNLWALRQAYYGKITAISIGFEDNPWTEVPLAKKLAKDFEADFLSYEINGKELDDIPLIIRQLGDPFQEGGLMVNDLTMKLAKDLHFDVILGGDGNDQMFGTSIKELAMHWKLQRAGLSWLQKILNNAGSNPFFNKNVQAFRLNFHNRKILKIIESDCFGFHLQQAARICNLLHSPKNYSYCQNYPHHYDSFNELYYARNFLIDIEQVINEVIVFKASKLADFYGNHLSFPYLSNDLYNFLLTLPRTYKAKGTVDELAKGKGIAKFIHKNYLKNELPPYITNRKKQGGFAPLPLFFKNTERRQLLKLIIRNSRFYKDFANQSLIESFFIEYDQRASNESLWFWYRQTLAFKYFNLLVIAIWWEIHIEQHQGKSLSDFL